MRKIYIKNDTRTVIRFLILPVLIDVEWRWLEFAKLEQVLRLVNGHWKWMNTQFKN